VLAALTLAGAVQFALSHSPRIAQQAAAVSQLRSAYVKARSQTLPGLSGSLANQMSKSANYTGAYSVIGAAQASVFSQNTAQLGTSYTFNGGLSQYLALAARQQYEQGQAQLLQTQQRLTNDVASAYFSLAGKDESVRLDRGDLRYQQTLVAVAKAKERAGVAAGVDVLSAQAAEEKSRYTLAAAQADASDAAEALAQIIGAPLEIAFDVPAQIAQPQLPAQPVEKLVALAQANRPDVASAQDAIAIARTNRRAADTDLFPQIQTFASVGNQFSPTLAVQQASFGPVTRGNRGFWNVGIDTSLSLPFIDWGARRANHRDLDEQIGAAKSNLDAARAQVEIDVRQAYRAAKTALAQLASAQDETRYASEASRIAELQYAHGLITLPDVQQRQQSALSAEVDLYNARVAYATSIVKLRVALGVQTPAQTVADL
jgi:outer membrane protein TolC